MCHVSHVTCQLSHVIFFLFIKKFDKVVELVGGGSVINGAYPVYLYYDKISYMCDCFYRAMCVVKVLLGPANYILVKKSQHWTVTALCLRRD